MNILFVSNSKEISKAMRLHAGLITLCVIGLFCVPVLLGFFGYKHALSVGSAAENRVTSLLKDYVYSDWHDDTVLHGSESRPVNESTDSRFKALTLRVAELQARLVRLDALGERIVLAADLEEEEFDFSKTPPLGGPHGATQSYQPLDFLEELDHLTARIEEREQQLNALDSLLANKKIEDEVFLTGRPITKGWMSSHFGRRTDPFTGRLAWHKGVDFAGREGSDIISVGSGVVTWAGKRAGYGYLVEINHGSGYSTRYGHCQKVLVQVGDIVRKGQVVALMGSTGRSTGPHVHFEVLVNGVQVNPLKYVRRGAKL